MLLELLNLVLGIAFGFLHRGREDYAGLVRNGAIAGFLLGAVLVLAAVYLVPKGLSIDLSVFGIAGIFAEIFLFLIIFLLGTFIGDILEGIRKR